MPAWAEWVLVALLVAASAAYAVWQLLPVGWRLRWQVRFGWRVGSAACGCDACPAVKTTNANSDDKAR